MTDARFYTVANARFFPGTVALLNSLRLTGHAHELVVLDAGLRPELRARLEAQTTVVDLSHDSTNPLLLKPYPYVVGATGTVVVIDSDIIVTSSLGGLIEAASHGVCVLSDDQPHPHYTTDPHRWFPEWRELLDLEAPLRRGTYVNTGVIALSTYEFPELPPLVGGGAARSLRGDRGRGSAPRQPAVRLGPGRLQRAPDERGARRRRHGRRAGSVGRARARRDPGCRTARVRPPRAPRARLHYTPWKPRALLRVQPDAFVRPAPARPARQGRPSAPLARRRPAVATRRRARSCLPPRRRHRQPRRPARSSGGRREGSGAG